MTTEQVLQEISDVMKQNTECKRNSNEALTHATNVIRNMAKSAKDYEQRLKEEYERGVNDGFVACKQLACCVGEGGLPLNVIEDFFDMRSLSEITAKYSPIEIVQKLKVCEEVESQVEDELNIGDVVRLIYENDHCASLAYEGIYVGGDETVNWLLMSGSHAPTWFHKTKYSIVKTGKHVDLFKEV